MSAVPSPRSRRTAGLRRTAPRTNWHSGAGGTVSRKFDLSKFQRRDEYDIDAALSMIRNDLRCAHCGKAMDSVESCWWFNRLDEIAAPRFCSEQHYWSALGLD